MLPDVHNQHLARREGKQRALPLKVLVLAALAAVGALDVHDQDVIRDRNGVVALAALLPLVLGEPYPLGRLPPLRLGHYGELSAEEHVEQGRLAGRLRPEDRDEVVVEARIDDVGLLEVRVEVRAAGREVSLPDPAARGRRVRGGEGGSLEGLVLVDDLDPMLVLLRAWLLANRCKVAVHSYGFAEMRKKGGRQVYRDIGDARWLKRLG